MGLAPYGVPSRFAEMQMIVTLSVGGGLGAAFVAWHRLGGGRSFVMDHAYWGPQFDARDISSLLAARRAEVDAAGCTICDVTDESEFVKRAAAAIADGKVVRWFDD